MRKLMLILTLLAGNYIWAGDLLIISGSVSELNTGNPVPNHQVYFEDTDSLFFLTTLTDQNGQFLDTIFTQGTNIETLHVYTFDCELLVVDTIIVQPNIFININFKICVNDSIPDCEAGFAYEQPLNSTLINFTDLSTGSIDSWYWNFGDGSFSSDQNPSHTYPGAGIYYVCLTISNNDSLEPCYDLFCDSVWIIADTINNCQAKFSYQPDSTSTTPYLVFFNDLSVGNPSVWLWDFGDNNTATGPNPEHVYPGPGTYNVCLTISNDSAGISCSDTYCNQINVPEYYDIGGFVYAGDYPLNNPLPTGDTGIILSYRQYDSGLLQPVDTSLFYNYGYYWFIDVMEGNYIMKISLTENSTRYNQYFPTYSGSRLKWNEAIAFNLTDSNMYASNIHLLPKAILPGGSGTIEGEVYWCQNNSGRFQYDLSDIEIILSDQNNSPLDFTMTDQSGRFVFNNIPSGSYQLVADKTTVYSSEVNATIDQNNIYEYAEIELCETSIVGIEEYHTGAFNDRIKALYPNPFNDMVTVEFKEETEIKSIIISGLTGQQVYIQLHPYVVNNKTLIMTENLPEGIYFLTVTYSNSKFMESFKLIKLK